MSIKRFVDENYKHFNARALANAARAYRDHVNSGGKMFVTLAGAMSTAELGLSLSEMIRRGFVSGISCTGANLEEDLFNAVASSKYKIIENYRDLTPSDELALLNSGMNRVTDTCIPEVEAMAKVDSYISELWKDASRNGLSKLPHEFVFEMVLSNEFQREFETDPDASWVLAAAKNNVPLFVPGWEDSTLGNFFVSKVLKEQVTINTVRSGLSYMIKLVDWFKAAENEGKVGFFQIGGGIAGDFPICVVPLIEQDLGEKTQLWSYFCQITDAQESYGGYSGALPNEKITWGKIAPDAPKFVIHSDATIVAPLVFQYVLEA